MGAYWWAVFPAWALAIVGVLRFFHVAKRQGEAHAVLVVVHGGRQSFPRCKPRRRELQ